jgi:phosphate transport system permease protein
MTTAPALDRAAEPTPRRLSDRQTGSELVFEHVARAIGVSVLVITGGVGVFLAWQAFPTLQRYGWSFFTETQWQPEADTLGIGAVLVGTLSVAMGR